MKILRTKGISWYNALSSVVKVHVTIVMQLALRVNMTSPNSSLTIRITEEEKAILKAYCKQTTRQQSEVIREFVRSLEKKLH